MRGFICAQVALISAFSVVVIAQTLPEELAGVISNYSSLSLFRSLLSSAPQALITTLSEKDSNVTVLIPTNNAIEGYLKASGVSDVTELNQTELQVFFSYHVMSASLTSSDFENPRGLSVPTLLQNSQFNNRSAGPQIQSQFGKGSDGQVIFASRQDRNDKRADDNLGGPNVMLRAGLAQDVKMTAVDGSWGTNNVNSFQIVDKVLSPPRSCSNTVHTIKDTRLVGLNVALVKAGLWPALDASRNVTCLAPSTQAFKNAGSPDVKLSKQDLAGALLAHTLNEVTYSNYLRDGQIVGTLNNTEVRVSIRGNDIFFNNAKVIEANILTNNGLIHILDSVIEEGDVMADPEEETERKRDKVGEFMKKSLNKGEIALKHAVGLGGQPNVVPVTQPVVHGPPRPVEVGWHPVGGFAGKWFAEETGLGKMITEKINRYPDPTQHWAVLVGDYAHQLWMDENFDVIYTNAKVNRDEWRTFPVGETRFNDDALRRAGESVIQSIRERQPTYNLITNNCQTYVLQLLDAIKVGVNKEFGTTLAVYERVFGPGKIKDLFEGDEPPEGHQQQQIEPGPDTRPDAGSGRSDTVNLAQNVMNQNTTQLDTGREMERHEDEKKEKKKKGFFSQLKARSWSSKSQ
ncbi:hypothetical protein FAUST_3872 [Fusarium austroamericanum]|uniref:FAS1 domain-containing protein n=1 Tax=Fusarium austroamericanum TaxID=282268 RepID=A0AAN6C454_FUSAU|nr:hypothetical protein FAUST_3872 [Fusarium austroamericanum]